MLLLLFACLIEDVRIGMGWSAYGNQGRRRHIRPSIPLLPTCGIDVIISHRMEPDIRLREMAISTGLVALFTSR